MLITLILIVFATILISLFTGLFFLFTQKENNKHLLISLSFRVTLTLILLALVTYGLYSGQLGNKAPWAQPSATSHQINEDKQP